MSKTEQSVLSDVQRLTQMVKEAIELSKAAARTIKARDAALDRLTKEIGGDRIAAIRNGQQRIGALMTESKRP